MSCISVTADIDCPVYQLLQILSVIYTSYCRYLVYCILVTAGIERIVSQLLQIFCVLYLSYCRY